MEIYCHCREFACEVLFEPKDENDRGLAQMMYEMILNVCYSAYPLFYPSRCQSISVVRFSPQSLSLVDSRPFLSYSIVFGFVCIHSFISLFFSQNCNPSIPIVRLPSVRISDSSHSLIVPMPVISIWDGLEVNQCSR